MTLIAFATYPDRIEFVTDTASYTDRVTHMRACTKHLILPHLDAAVLAQGDQVFGDLAGSSALQVSSQVITFDELVESAPEWLTNLWEMRSEERANMPDSMVVLLGYSLMLGRFVAYAFTSEDGFAQREIPGLFVTPSPWRLAPSEIELGRFRTYVAERDDGEQLIEAWLSWDAGQPPKSVGEWVELACQVREQRAMQPFGHVIVAGRVLHTRLERGSVHTRRVHEFDDSGEEFLRLVAGTHHPQAQLSPCVCGSGKRALDCHLADELDDTCGCASGQRFRECCMVVSPV